MTYPYHQSPNVVDDDAAQRAECRDWPRAPQVGDKCELEACKRLEWKIPRGRLVLIGGVLQCPQCEGECQ